MYECNQVVKIQQKAPVVLGYLVAKPGKIGKVTYDMKMVLEGSVLIMGVLSDSGIPAKRRV